MNRLIKGLEKIGILRNAKIETKIESADKKWWCSLWVECSDQLFEEFLIRKDAGQGWPELGDLSELIGQRFENIEKFIKKGFLESYGDECSGPILSTFRYMFSPEIGKGDIIVARQGSEIYGIGIIKDPTYLYWPQSVNYRHRIKTVEWIAHNFPGYIGYRKNLTSAVSQKFLGRFWQFILLNLWRDI